MRKRTIDPNTAYTLEEVASLLQCSARTVQRLIEDKRLKSGGTPGLRRVLGKQLIEFLEVKE